MATATTDRSDRTPSSVEDLLTLQELQASLNSDLATACRRGLSRLRRSVEAAVAAQRCSPLLVQYLASSPLCTEMLSWFDGVVSGADGHRILATELYRSLATVVGAMASHGHAAHAPLVAASLIDRLPKRFVVRALTAARSDHSSGGKAVDDAPKATLLALLAALAGIGAATALRLLPRLELRSKEIQGLFWEQAARRRRGGKEEDAAAAPPKKKRRKLALPAEWSLRSQVSAPRLPL